MVSLERVHDMLNGQTSGERPISREFRQEHVKNDFAVSITENETFEVRINGINQPLANTIKIGNVAVVSKGPAAILKWMTVQNRIAALGRLAHMGHNCF